jgi:hypothetical protein
VGWQGQMRLRKDGRMNKVYLLYTGAYLRV